MRKKNKRKNRTEILVTDESLKQYQVPPPTVSSFSSFSFSFSSSSLLSCLF